VSDLVRDIEPPRASFALAEKVTPARLTVRLADGRTFERAREIPLGAAGPDTRQRHRELVREKFAICRGPSEVAEMVETLEDATAREVAGLLEAALATEPARLSRDAHAPGPQARAGSL
jgi:hypothetical protein